MSHVSHGGGLVVIYSDEDFQRQETSGGGLTEDAPFLRRTFSITHPDVLQHFFSVTLALHGNR
jgi:hypothetical protein